MGAAVIIAAPAVEELVGDPVPVAEPKFVRVARLESCALASLA